MGALTPTLAVDLDTRSVVAAVVTDEGAWPVPDPASGELTWPCSIHSFRPVEPVMELLAGVRAAAQRGHGPVGRALLTIPASYSSGDPRRARLINAAEAAGFIAVELLSEPYAVVCGTSLPTGSLVLVYDLGVTVEAALVRVGDTVVGHIGPVESDAATTVAAGQDLLARHGVGPGGLSAIVPVGMGSRTPGLSETLSQAFGAPVHPVEDPELAVIRGAAAWLQRSGARTVPAQVPAQRTVPLSFAIPGGAATVMRWLVAPNQAYEPGAAMVRVRLADGALWDLTARSGGTVEQVIVGDGERAGAGEWLAFVAPS
jgi:molecular chaperone DnaK (HSP70)